MMVDLAYKTPKLPKRIRCTKLGLSNFKVKIEGEVRYPSFDVFLALSCV